MKAQCNYTNRFSLGIVIDKREITIALIFLIIDITF